MKDMKGYKVRRPSWDNFEEMVEDMWCEHCFDHHKEDPINGHLVEVVEEVTSGTCSWCEQEFEVDTRILMGLSSQKLEELRTEGIQSFDVQHDGSFHDSAHYFLGHTDDQGEHHISQLEKQFSYALVADTLNWKLSRNY